MAEKTCFTEWLVFTTAEAKERKGGSFISWSLPSGRPPGAWPWPGAAPQGADVLPVFALSSRPCQPGAPCGRCPSAALMCSVRIRPLWDPLSFACRYPLWCRRWSLVLDPQCSLSSGQRVLISFVQVAFLDIRTPCAYLYPCACPFPASSPGKDSHKLAACDRLWICQREPAVAISLVFSESSQAFSTQRRTLEASLFWGLTFSWLRSKRQRKVKLSDFFSLKKCIIFLQNNYITNSLLQKQYHL